MTTTQQTNLKTSYSRTYTALTLIFPPVIVAALLLTVFAFNGLYPFGDKTLAWCDMRQQVVPLILDFKDILAGRGDFFLNMQNASGMNFYGVFLFFISSPFTFLCCLVDKADMMVFMNLLTVLKAAVSALTAALYFRVCHKKLNGFFTVLLSVMYATGGYLMLFYQNTVWLDVMYFFPLLMISFRSLTRNRNNAGLIFCLVGMLALNYYLSYMVVLFTILYFGVYLFLKRKKPGTKGIASRFVIGCVIAALISAVVWLPSFIQYLSSARGADVLSGIAASSLFTEIYTSLPMIFCTTFGIAAVVIFFGRRVTFESRFYTALLILMLIPVVFEPINKMWHTGDYMSFPVRYGYITILLLLAVSAVKLKWIKAGDFALRSSLPHLIICFGLCAAAGIGSVIYYYAARESLDAYSTTLHGNMDSFLLIFAATGVFCAIFGYIIFAGISGRLSYKPFCAGLMIMTAITAVFNANVYISAASYKPVVYDQAMALEDKIPDDGFYRVKNKQAMKKYFDANLLGGLGYNTIAHYTSLTSEDYMFAMKKLGYSSYWMEVTGSGGTLLSDALMSVRYTIEKYYSGSDYVYHDNVYTIRRNGFSLPAGLITDSDLSRCADLPDMTRVGIQEYLADTLLGADKPLFTEYPYNDAKNARVTRARGKYNIIRTADSGGESYLYYDIDVKGKQTLYFDCFDQVSRRLTEHINQSFSLYINGQYADALYPSQDSNGMLELGTFENERVNIAVKVERTVSCRSFGVFGLSHEALTDVTSGAKGADMNVNGRELTWRITGAKDGQWLFIPVPYDEGFTASINGEDTGIYRVMTGFTAVRLKDGENSVRLYFTPRGFDSGLMISFAGTALCVLWLIFRGRLNRAADKLDGICRIGVYALCCAVLLIIYIAPMVINILGALKIIS